MPSAVRATVPDVPAQTLDVRPPAPDDASPRKKCAGMPALTPGWHEMYGKHPRLYGVQRSSYAGKPQTYRIRPRMYGIRRWTYLDQQRVYVIQRSPYAAQPQMYRIPAAGATG